MDISHPDDEQFTHDEAEDQAEPRAQALPASGPAPLDTTGLPQRFADVLGDVDAVSERPLDEHTDVFTRAHRELTDALGDVDRGDS